MAQVAADINLDVVQGRAAAAVVGDSGHRCAQATLEGALFGDCRRVHAEGGERVVKIVFLSTAAGCIQLGNDSGITVGSG